jgi:hypothetical protein
MMDEALEALGTKNRNAMLANANRRPHQANDLNASPQFPHNNPTSTTTTAMKGDEQNQRPRSRAIAIKRNTRPGSTASNEDGLDEPTCSTEQMYDWATWRMYNRITDHRRRHPIRYFENPVVASAEERGQGNELKDAASCGRVGSSRRLQHEEHFFDGEVFDLEL